MAKKTKTTQYMDMPEFENGEYETDVFEQELPGFVDAHDTPAAPTADPQAPGIATIKKKRIRVRKKATKKLSVAILCANPSTKRFI